MRRACEDINMQVQTMPMWSSIVRRAAREGRDVVVHAVRYDGQRNSYYTYRVTDLHETADGRIVGITEHGELWEVTVKLEGGQYD